MLSEQLRQIVGYFVEETADCMEQLESELQFWRGAVLSAESANLMMRSVHSIKGGAAMLGFGGIQRTAQGLEECFSLLRDCPVSVDAKLDGLVGEIVTGLRELLGLVSLSKGENRGMSDQVIQRVEPLFAELNSHLLMLIPARLTLRVTTDDEYCYILSGYCLSLVSFFQAIGEAVSNLRGTVVRHEQDGERRVSVDIQLPGETNLDGICGAVQSAGGIIGNVQTERLFPIFIGGDYFGYRGTPEQPATCRGCNYYYGRNDGGNVLICAIHPHGPEEDICRDAER